MENYTVILLVCSIGQLLGFVIFLKGFFPVKEAVTGYADWEKLGTNLTGEIPPKEHFSRMVFILIDALRADFVLPETESSLPKMEFLKSKIMANETYSFVAKAHPPTVTLPRIKALTTGGIPGFVDVVLNIDSESLTEDNIVTQLNRAGKQVVFYGDDTWMRLFPDHFIRTDGTTSFFVTDYTEVDNNVTRHLQSELSPNPDWDMLILHYLGLDHIGHLAGPKSSLIKPKLKEMDDIVKLIYQSVAEMDKARDERSLVFVCGDHGMSDQGSHGGSSPSETLTPFVFLSPQYENHQGQAFDQDKNIYQIDLAPTLSLLLGLPVPQNSLGTLVLDLFSKLEPKEKLQLSHINARQIVEVFKQNTPQYERDNSYLVYQRALKQHENWLQLFSSTNKSNTRQLEDLSERILALYEDAMIGMRSNIASSLAQYDLHAMGVGICVIWMVLFIQLWLYYSLWSDPNTTRLVSYHSLSVAVLSETVYLGLHTTLCTSVYRSDLLCISSPSYSWLLHLVPAVVLWVFVLVLWSRLQTTNRCTLHMNHTQKTKDHLTKEGRFLSQFLLWGTVCHTVSMLSSSFIEEEHQTWYFLTVTVNLIICFINVRNYMLTDANYPIYNKSKTSEHLTSQGKAHDIRQDCHGNRASEPEKSFHGKVSRQLSSHGDTSFAYQDGCLMKQGAYQKLNQGSGNNLAVEGADKTKRRLVDKDREGGRRDVVMCCVGVLVLCRICRTWNRTGDKWAHLPDVGDWLTSPENRLILSSVSVFSLAILAAMVKKMFSFINWLLFTIGAVCVYMFRAATGDLLCPELYDSRTKAKGVIEARFVYLFILLILLHSLYHIILKLSSTKLSREDYSHRILVPELFTVVFKHIQLCFLLLMLLLVRPHNISLVTMEFIQLLLVHRITLHMNLSVLSTCLLYIWMGQAAFFYQGNSNSLSAVDVSAGYVGIESYNPVVIGILMAFATFAGPLLWNIGLISALGEKALQECEKAEKDGKKVNSRFLRHLSQAAITECLTRTLPLSLYVILVTIQRYHLFVWTVFSPKLLYQGMYSLVLATFYILLLIVKSCFA